MAVHQPFIDMPSYMLQVLEIMWSCTPDSPFSSRIFSSNDQKRGGREMASCGSLCSTALLDTKDNDLPHHQFMHPMETWLRVGPKALWCGTSNSVVEAASSPPTSELGLAQRLGID